MVASILDAVRFLATSNGTADFLPASTVTGYQSMSAAGAVDATTYYYRAESADLTEWEIGLGTWTSGTTTLARTTVLFSSNSNSKVSFTSAPNVGIVALAENLVTTKSRTLLATLTASNSATLSDTTHLTSTYALYEFELDTIVPATDATNLEAQVSTDAGSTWKTTGYISDMIVMVSTGCGPGVNYIATTTYIPLGASVSNSAANGGVSGLMKLVNPSGAASPKSIFGQTANRITSAINSPNSISGFWNGTTAITAIKFFMSSGNITSGAIRLYGINTTA